MINEQKTFELFGYTSKELTDGSKKKVVVKCDYCGDELEKTKQSITIGNKEINKDACKKCRFKKREDISISQHGVSNSAQRSDVKSKLQKNNSPDTLHKDIIELMSDGCSISATAVKLNISYGTLHRYCKKHDITPSSTVQERRDKTLEEKHGKGYKEIMYNKTRDAVRERYGVDNVFQSEEIKEKSKATCISKYGVEYAMQNEAIQEKKKETFMTKYGVDNPGKIHVKIIGGKTAKEWSMHTGFSKSRTHVLLKQHGPELMKDMTPRVSTLETLISNWLDENNINYTTQLKVEKLRADFYIPENNLIIEVDGNYWHSDANENLKSPKYYHRDKRHTYIKNNYKPLFFREDEVINKFPIVKSVIRNALGLTETKVGARKCTIEVLSKDKAKEALNTNHLMGHGAGTTYCLMYQGNPVSYLQLKRINNNNYEISRFCHNLNTNVVGGFSRLLKYVEGNIDNIESIKTFIDLRYGTGHYLESLGFVSKKPHVSFKWVKNMEICGRMTFRNNSGYDAGFSKLWDCGQLPFIKYIKQQKEAIV